MASLRLRTFNNGRPVTDKNPFIQPSDSETAPMKHAEEILGRLFTILTILLYVIGTIFVIHYRSTSPSVGPYSWRYVIGALAPFLGMFAVTVGVLILPATLLLKVIRRFNAIPRWLRMFLVLTIVVFAEHSAFNIADEYISVLLLILVPITAAVAWMRLSHNSELGLVFFPFLLFALVLFATELPEFLSSPALVVWGEKSTFRYLFPTHPPFIGPGGRLQPGLNTLMRAPEYPHGARLLTESHGFRSSHEITMAPLPGRILSLGDSFAVGFCADQDKFYGSILENQIAEKETNAIEVISAEVSDPAYGLYYLQNFGALLTPNVILYGLSGNDVLQTGWFVGPKRRFTLQKNILAANSDAQSKEEDFFAEYRDYSYPQAGKNENLPFTPVGTMLLAKLVRFRIFSSLLNAGQRIRNKPMVMPGHMTAYERIDHRLRLIDGAANLAFFYKRNSGPIDGLYKNFFQVIAAMNATARASGAEFVLVLFPQRYQVQPGDWEVMWEFWNLDPKDFYLELADRRIVAACRERGIHCLDLLDAFRKAAPSGPLYLPGGDVHFNRHGHEVAACTVADYLLAEGLIKSD